MSLNITTPCMPLPHSNSSYDIVTEQLLFVEKCEVLQEQAQAELQTPQSSSSGAAVQANNMADSIAEQAQSQLLAQP